MTKEEAVKILQNICFEVPEIKEALQIAIGALSKPQSISNMEEEKQSVEGLEEEIGKWMVEDCGPSDFNPYADHWCVDDIQRTARHFAEWGEKNAYKVIMKKADEVRDKMFDTDYEVKIEPAAGFDFGCVNVYHEGKLVGQYVEPKEGKKLSEGLEEAARLYAIPHYMKDIDVEHIEDYPYDSGLEAAFIAGAEWQKEKTAWVYLKEAKDAVIALEKEKGEPLNPRVAFVNGARWQKQQDQETIELAEDHAMLAGMNKMEQQMMEKAYDTVMQFDELDDLVPTFEDMQKFGFKVGDKVKVIILKEK